MQNKEDDESPPARVGVLGGSGYTGREVLKLLGSHPSVEVVFATSRSLEGEASGVGGVPFSVPDEGRCRDVDVLFLCLPHGKAAHWVQRLGGTGPRIIDLTADHRPGSGRESGAVYGLAEWSRQEVAGADLVANPGCYPTGVITALLPLAEAGLLDSSRLAVVNAASGVTGAGRTPRADLLFGEVAENFRTYGTGNRHRHLREMRALLQDRCDLVFQPHLLPVRRGILETMVIPTKQGVGVDEVRSAWAGAYGSAPAIQRLDSGLPALSHVVQTDQCALGVETLADIKSSAVMVGAALDNLGKGAAGQAIQNLNAMYDWPTERGIRC